MLNSAIAEEPLALITLELPGMPNVRYIKMRYPLIQAALAQRMPHLRLISFNPNQNTPADRPITKMVVSNQSVAVGSPAGCEL